MKTGKIVIFSAPSGAGKTTIVKRFLADDPKRNLLSISAVNRPKRDNETHGIDYYFTPDEEFQQKIKNKEFVEWEEVYKGRFYGTLESEVDRLLGFLNSGKNIFFDVDVKGALSLKKYFEEKGIQVILIFIKPEAPEMMTLRKRLMGRNTETDESIEHRLDKAPAEMSFQTSFDRVVVNDNVERAFMECKSYIYNWLN